MNELPRHANKTVLVTGGASGTGLGIVDRFLAEVANVVSIALHATDLHSTDCKGTRFHALEGDVTDEATVKRAVGASVAALGGLDVMVCNAGIITVTHLVAMDLA